MHFKKEGYETVTFYNIDGSMGYRPDDSFLTVRRCP